MPHSEIRSIRISSPLRAALLLGAALLAGATSACGAGAGSTASPLTLCTEVNRRDCALAFQCLTMEQRTAGGYPMAEADCITQGETVRMCPSKNEQNTCATGRTYDGAAASACVDEWNAATCANYAVNNPDSACNQVCK